MSEGIPTLTQINEYAVMHELQIEIIHHKDFYGNDRITVVFNHSSSTDDGLVNFRIRIAMAHALAINNGVVYGGGYDNIMFYEKKKGT